MTLVYDPKKLDNNNFDIDQSPRVEPRPIICDQLRAREQQWCHARKRISTLQERQMFWYGDNSSIMWLLWQLVAYVVAAIILMLSTRLLGFSMSVWVYPLVFGLQTILFFVLLHKKGRLANRIQTILTKTEMTCKQAFNEMDVLAKDSVFPDVHANSPLSLKCIYERCEAQLHLITLRCLLQKEVEAGRMIIKQKRVDADVLPIDLADEDLIEHASEIIYKSTL